MESVEKDFEKFLTGSGSGYGSGYGSGDGSGDSDGYGYGSGYGSGNSDGDGYGSGSGYGSGDGYGSGSGDGYGSGSGYGSGDGYSDVSGDGYSDVSDLKKVNGHKVFYVDDIPCIPIEVHNIWAKISVINKKDFSMSECFLSKYRGFIAHGNSVKNALRDAQEKYLSSFDFDELKGKLLEEFKEKGSLTVAELFKWHGLLTGSCTFGRQQFQKEHELKDTDRLTLTQFVGLTKNDFGGDKIKELISE